MGEVQTTRDGKKTKALILKKAMELFSLHGYKGASVRKIASAVGIRESALYNHFRNKEAIFHAIASSMFEVPLFNASQSDRLLEHAKGGKNFLNRFISDYKLITFDAQNEKLFRILMLELFHDESLRSRFMEEYHDRNVKMLSQAFFVMMQENLVRSADPMLMANEFLAPLFYLRLQVTLLRLDSRSTAALATQFEKHVEFFWENVAVK